MPSKALQAHLQSKTPSGVYWLKDHASIKELSAAAKVAKLAFYHLEGAKIERKEQFLNHASVVLHFPSDTGKNWDAFYDCLTDMEWAPAAGYLVYFDHTDAFAEHHESELETVVELFQDAVDYWDEEGKPLLVLLSGKHAPEDIEKL
jgi:RNAse (barnase) inhibitor barstar